nr:centriolar coiled-coil protein of 110 kDa isoform X3 [Misgurnus anguillicaudatus]
MESYEEFCSRTLKTFLMFPDCSTAPQQQRAHVSNIHFHGRRLLEPVLSEELRAQMAEERQTAIQRDRKRQTRQTDALLERVQDIINNIHLRNVQYESVGAVPHTAELSPTLQSKMSPDVYIRPSSTPVQNQTLRTSSSLKKETLRLLNQRMEREKNHDDESSDRLYSGSPDSVLSGLSLSLTGSYVQLPSPQPSRSPLTQRTRRPHILISCPVSESELGPNGSEYKNHPSGRAEQSVFIEPGAQWDYSCSESSDRQLSITTSTPSTTSNHKEIQSSLTRSQDKPARRSPPAPLNQSYDVESPSPFLIRPQVRSTPSSCSGGHGSDLDGFSQCPLEDRMNIKQPCTAETQQTDEQEIEALHERLKKEDSQQISDNLTAQKKETLKHQQEVQRRCDVTSSVLSVSWTQTAELKTQHNLNTLVSEEHMKGFCRFNALARGFLTRRLLQTDKIKHLRKTVQDTREFIQSFQNDPQLKRVSISYQDLSLQHRVTAQLRAALHDIHQIFFVWPMKHRLQLLQKDREIHTERTIREMEKVKSSGIRQILSSATQKSLERNKHRQTKRTKMMAKTSSGSRVLRSSLGQNGVRQLSVVKQKEECMEVKQPVVHRKCLSLR